jgi:uncharacterized membrane protein
MNLDLFQTGGGPVLTVLSKLTHLGTGATYTDQFVSRRKETQRQARVRNFSRVRIASSKQAEHISIDINRYLDVFDGVWAIREVVIVKLCVEFEFLQISTITTSGVALEALL